MRGDRELIPAAAIQKSSIPLLVSTDAIGTPSTPLVEEERYPLSYSLAPDAIHPFRTHRSGFRPALAANDHPVNSSKIDRSNILEEWLDRQETN